MELRRINVTQYMGLEEALAEQCVPELLWIPIRSPLSQSQTILIQFQTTWSCPHCCQLHMGPDEAPTEQFGCWVICCAAGAVNWMQIMCTVTVRPAAGGQHCYTRICSWPLKGATRVRRLIRPVLPVAGGIIAVFFGCDTHSVTGLQGCAAHSCRHAARAGPAGTLHSGLRGHRQLDHSRQGRRREEGVCSHVSCPLVVCLGPMQWTTSLQPVCSGRA